MTNHVKRLSPKVLSSRVVTVLALAAAGGLTGFLLGEAALGAMAGALGGLFLAGGG